MQPTGKWKSRIRTSLREARFSRESVSLNNILQISITEYRVLKVHSALLTARGGRELENSHSNDNRFLSCIRLLWRELNDVPAHMESYMLDRLRNLYGRYRGAGWHEHRPAHRTLSRRTYFRRAGTDRVRYKFYPSLDFLSTRRHFVNFMRIMYTRASIFIKVSFSCRFSNVTNQMNASN